MAVSSANESERQARAPRLSIVTPSYNQAAFIDATMSSVIGQRYPELEYIVVDGGSSDGSAEIVRRRSGELAWWVSERDAGQYDAINKGFARSTGEIMAWINSDDMYTPWAFAVVADIFARHPEVEWLTSAYPLIWDREGRAVSCGHLPGFSRRSFLRAENLPCGRWYATGWIQQESTFWRRSLWERAGARVDAGRRLASDFGLWAAFFEHAELYAVQTPLAGFRLHGAQKSVTDAQGYVREGLEILRAAGGAPGGGVGSALRRALVGAPRFLRSPARRLRLIEGFPLVCWALERQCWEIRRR